MAELNYEENLKLSNDKAHLEVIAGNIRDATSELAVLLENKTNLESEISDLKPEFRSTLIAKQEAEDKLTSLNETIRSKEEELASMQAESLNDLEQKQLLLEQNINALENYKSVLDSATKGLRDSIDEYVKEKYKAEEDKESARQKLYEVESSIVQARSDYSKIESEIIAKAIELSDLEKATSKIQLDYQLLMVEIGKSIEAEKAKITRPLELLAEEERIVDKKKRNLDILLARLRPKFEIMFPEQEIKL